MSRIFQWSRRPTTAQYVAGLKAITPQMNDLQKRILVAQYHAPERTAFATELAHLAKIQGGYPTVNAQYGRLGHLFCDATGLEPDKREIGTSRWWAVWSLGHSTPKGFIWEMLPEVAEALEQLGWVAAASFALPDEMMANQALIEGAVWRVTVNAYERNPIARTRCIAHYGLTCVVCGFNFGAVYGPLAEEFIHVHHLKPLAEIGEQYEVDPLTDLRPVCANCHAVIHLGGGCRSIEEARRLVDPRVLAFWTSFAEPGAAADRPRE